MPHKCGTQPTKQHQLTLIVDKLNTNTRNPPLKAHIIPKIKKQKEKERKKRDNR